MRRARADEFQRLLEPLRGILHAYARRMLHERQVTEDVLQEALVAAYAAFDRFESGTNFRAWIFAFVTRTALAQNRRDARHLTLGALPPTAGRDMADVLAEEEAYASLLENPALIPEVLDDRLTDALRSLSRPERAVLLLRAIPQLTYREIAATLGCPIGTVMGTLHRARIKVRRTLVDSTLPSATSVADERGGA